MIQSFISTYCFFVNCSSKRQSGLEQRNVLCPFNTGRMSFLTVSYVVTYTWAGCSQSIRLFSRVPLTTVTDKSGAQSCKWSSHTPRILTGQTTKAFCMEPFLNRLRMATVLITVLPVPISSARSAELRSTRNLTPTF